MDWRKLVKESLVRPRSAARDVIDLGLGRDLLIQAAAAITAIGVVLGFIAVRLSTGPVDAVSATILTNPLLGAALQFGIILVAGFLTYRIGAACGGTGDFDGALAVVVWLNAMMLVIQLVQLVVLLIVPPFAGLIAVATVVWALWAFANFVTELHGFENPYFVLGGVILSMIVLFVGIAMLLAILGITPQEPIS
jgi:hypothetical protein